MTINLDLVRDLSEAYEQAIRQNAERADGPQTPDRLAIEGLASLLASVRVMNYPQGRAFALAALRDVTEPIFPS